MKSSLWPALRATLRERLDEEEFRTWIKPLGIRQDDDRVVLVAPSSHFRHNLKEQYGQLFDEITRDLDSTGVRIVVDTQSQQPPPTPKASARLDPRYRFDSFVVGSSNQFAHAAARAVAESPSHSYNPLFVYGGSGLGKTHLLHAIGHHIQAKFPDLRMVYVQTEQFVNELINSIRFERMPVFRERYRTIDVLLVDDIHVLANKERTQEEFFHTFNTLYTAPEADHLELGLLAAQHPDSRGALAQSLRMGADRRHPGPGPRDQDRHPPPQVRSRENRRPR